MIGELASCVPALAIGAGAHLIFDIIGYVVVFAIGSKVGHACGHKHGFNFNPFRSRRGRN